MSDPEKGHLPPHPNPHHQDIPQDLDAPLEHPTVSTTLDNESNPSLTGLDSKSPSIHSSSPSIHSNSSTLSIHTTPLSPHPSHLSTSSNKNPLSRTHSSQVVREPIVVPAGQRRGLLARCTLISEVENPYWYGRGTKWAITFQVAIAAAAAPMGSAILLPALPDLTTSLHSTHTITNLSVALYMLSMSIFPLWWSSFSETLGRRTIYLVSFTLFLLFNIISALSTTMPMLIILRMLSGGASASVQAVGAGTIADIWEVHERGRAMGYFYLGPLLGPLLAPIIGGALSQKWGWRATGWFQVIYAGVLVVVLVLGLPETLARRNMVAEEDTEGSREQDEVGGEEKTTRPAMLTRTSTRQSIHVKTKKFARVFKRCIIDPLSVLGFLRFPAVLLTVYLASITFGSLYVLNISIQDTFSSPPYSFSTIILGLLYIPNSLGYVLASLVGGRWVDHIMHREAIRAGRYNPTTGKLIFQPEDRMRENAWIAAIIFPSALIWYGWTAEKGVFWLVPMIANFFFGVGSMIIFGVATTMLTEFMPRKSSSGVAVNNFVRNIFSCVGGIVAEPVIGAIGNGWLFTIVGLVCWVSAFGVVWAMRRFGPRWRVVMDKKLPK